jgi:peroxin-12
MCLLGLKLSQWWYSPSSPRSIAATQGEGNKHARILPPRPLDILPSSGLLPPTPPYSPGDVPGEELGIKGGEEKSKEYVIQVEEFGTCPLCKERWKNPCVLPSGWVVCWRCGWESVEGEEEDESDGDSISHGDDSAVASEEAVLGNGNDSELTGRKRRKGRCPITGVLVRPGELRRVLV